MPKYVFQNLEDDKLPVTTFTYEGERYVLPQNGIVELSEDIADHLNELTYPNYLKSVDAFTGEEKAIPIPGKRRFSVVPASKKRMEKQHAEAK